MLKRALLQIHICRLIRLVLAKVQTSDARWFLFPCAAIVLGSTIAWAQEPATSLDQLKLLLGQGDKITLVNSSGNKIIGRVHQLLPDGIDLKVNETVRTFKGDEIRQIIREKPDSPLNGFLIGAGVGFGSTLPLNLGFASHDETGVAVAASAIWGLMGGGIGALVDAFVHGEQMIYFQPRKTVTWSIRPFFSDWPRQPSNSGLAVIPHGLPSSGVPKSSKGIRATVSF
jgi:hypothetical protein